MERTLWWHTSDAPPPSVPLSGSAEADVAVIGAGFTGLTAALHLARRGVRVIVLEATAIGSGASGVNAGFVVPNFSRSDPTSVLSRVGDERGRRLLELVGASGDRVFATVRELAIACDAEQVGWLQPAPSERIAEVLRERAEVWAGLGRPTTFLDAAATESLTGMSIYRGALLDRSGGTIHPLNFVRGLARAVQDVGGVIHERSPVMSAVQEGAGWRLFTSVGTVKACKLLLCTNAGMGGLATRLGRTVVPLTVHQVATDPIAPEVARRISPNRQPVSDARTNLFTYRLDRDNRLISGGMSVVPIGARERLGRQIVERLQRELRLPVVPSLAFVWQGRAAMTPDGLPHLYEFGPGFVGGIGCNGRGIAITAMLGEVLADAAMGARLHDLPVPLASARRIPFHSLAPLAASAAVLRARIKDWHERPRVTPS